MGGLDVEGFLDLGVGREEEVEENDGGDEQGQEIVYKDMEVSHPSISIVKENELCGWRGIDVLPQSRENERREYAAAAPASSSSSYIHM